MPPGCPHAVYTPEHSLTVGGTFYTWPTIGLALHALAAQVEGNFYVSNEELTVADLDNMTRMLSAGRFYTDPHLWMAMMTAKDRWKIPAGPYRQSSIPSLLPELQSNTHPPPKRHSAIARAEKKLQDELWRQHTQGLRTVFPTSR